MNNNLKRRSFLSKAALTGVTGAAFLSGYGSSLSAAVEKMPSYSNPSDLKITDVKCGYVRGALYVKIYTNQDIFGCGEAVDAIHGTYHLVKRLGRQIKGESPLNPNHRNCSLGHYREGIWCSGLPIIRR